MTEQIQELRAEIDVLHRQSPVNFTSPTVNLYVTISESSTSNCDMTRLDSVMKLLREKDSDFL